MKRFISILLAGSIAGACCILAVVIGASYQERKLDDLQKRLAWLENHKPREAHALRVWGAISTTDQPTNQSSLLESPDKSMGYSVFQPAAKSGPVIGPEFRIDAGSTNRQVFDIAIGPGLDDVIQAWVSDATPCDALASFEEFQLSAYHGHSTVLRLVARVKPKASVRMRFGVVLLCERQMQ